MAPNPKKVDGIFAARVAEAIWGIDEGPVAAKTEKKTEEVKVPERIFGRYHFVVRNTVLATTIIVLFSALLAGSAFGQERMYANKVYPGVVVWGVPVGGKTYDQVQEVLTAKIKDFKVNIKGPDQDYVATSNDLGVLFDTDSIALSAISKGRTGSFLNNVITRTRLLAAQIDWDKWQNIIRNGDLNLPIKYDIDEKTFNKFLNKVVNNINIKPQDSQILVTGGNTKIVPAVYGRRVDPDKFKNDLLSSIYSLSSSEIEVNTDSVKPAIIDKEAENVRIQTESVISRPVVLTYQGKEYRPNKETIGSWISYVKPTGATSYTLVVDTKKLSKYLSYLDSELSIYPIKKIVRVENGVKSMLIQEGKDGLLVDQTHLGKEIAQALPVQPSVELTIPMYVKRYTTQYDRVLVANWSKYIVIVLSKQTMTAYTKGGTVVGGPWKVTTGKQGYGTPVGNWLIHDKSAVTTMEGGSGYDYYYLENVHWVSWFKGGGYSIHEAWWRSTFGGSDYLYTGSHGCVNSPLSVAKWIYDWAPIGTPVIVRY